jgi:Fe-S cluster assembly ATPase SufC
LNFRNPAIEALEREIAKLKYQLKGYERIAQGFTTVVEPPCEVVGLKDVEFFRVATAAVSKDFEQQQYHFYSMVRTPPSIYQMNYYLTERMVVDSRSAYDTLSYVQEKLMNEFYKALNENRI